MTEVWKPVVGFEGRYEVSNLGRVRSLDRSWVQKSKHGTEYTHRKKGRMLRPGRKPSGHVSVALGRGKSYDVHVLVLTAFIGQRPAKHDVRHRNGAPSDNRLANLEWATRSVNGRDKKWHAGASTYKLRPKDVLEIKKLLRQRVTHREIGARFGVHGKHITSIACGRVHHDIVLCD